LLILPKRAAAPRAAVSAAAGSRLLQQADRALRDIAPMVHGSAAALLIWPMLGFHARRLAEGICLSSSWKHEASLFHRDRQPRPRLHFFV